MLSLVFGEANSGAGSPRPGDVVEDLNLDVLSLESAKLNDVFGLANDDSAGFEEGSLVLGDVSPGNGVLLHAGSPLLRVLPLHFFKEGGDLGLEGVLRLAGTGSAGVALKSNSEGLDELVDDSLVSALGDTGGWGGNLLCSWKKGGGDLLSLLLELGLDESLSLGLDARLASDALSILGFLGGSLDHEGDLWVSLLLGVVLEDLDSKLEVLA